MNRSRQSVGPRVGRREFLAGAGAAAIAGLGLPVLGAPRWTMRLSASSIAFSSLPIERACERIAALGFEAIDIWSAHAGCPHLDDVQKRLGPKGLKELLAKTGLKLFSFSVYAGGYPRYAELLGQMGGGVAVFGAPGPAAPKEVTPRMKGFLESLKPMVEQAERFNSVLAIENHGHTILDSLDSFKAFVDLNRNPRVGVALAPYHVQARGESVEEAIAVLGGQLRYFYAWQNADGPQQLPGVGPADCRGWLAALAKVNYAGFVNPFLHGEPPPEETARLLSRSRQHLLSIAP